MQVTMRHVAAKAGVSVQTVSRVLNQHPDVAPATRARVNAAIEDTGYEPNATARALVTRRTTMIGIATTSLTEVGLSEAFAGAAEACKHNGFDVLVHVVEPSPEAVTSGLKALTRRGVDGIVVQVPQTQLDEALGPDLGVPVPVVSLRGHHRASASLRVDSRGGARSVVEHLVATGRRRIGIVDARATGWHEAAERYEGWRSATLDAGLQIAARETAQGDWSAASGAAALHELIERSPDLDAVFASNDQMALGVLAASAVRGIRVPEDLAVAGFDNLAESAYFTPALTTVAQPLRELGERAVLTLLAKIQGAAGATAHELLPTHLIVRASTVAEP